MEVPGPQPNITYTKYGYSSIGQRWLAIKNIQEEMDLHVVRCDKCEAEGCKSFQRMLNEYNWLRRSIGVN